MSEQIRTQSQRQGNAETEDQDEVVDLGNAQLDEDVACCLEDIDAALDESAAEQEAMAERRTRDRAAARQDWYDNFSNSRRSAYTWMEKYEHLHANANECCGVWSTYFDDSEDEY